MILRVNFNFDGLVGKLVGQRVRLNFRVGFDDIGRLGEDSVMVLMYPLVGRCWLIEYIV